MMSDAEVQEQVERADYFREALRDAIRETIVNSSSLSADAQRQGLRRIAETLDAVPFVTLANLSNINAAMRGGLLPVIEVHLMAVGGGPTLDHRDATDFLAVFQPLIDVALRRQRQ